MRAAFFIFILAGIIGACFLTVSTRAQNATGTGSVTSTTGPNNVRSSGGSVSGDKGSTEASTPVLANNSVLQADVNKPLHGVINSAK